MKKVLLVANNDLDRGGIQNVIMSIVRNLSSDYRMDVVCFSSKKAYYDEELLQSGARLYRIPYYEGKSRFRRRLDFYVRLPKVYRNIRKILRQETYDVIHCHNGEDSAMCLLAAFAAKVPVRITHAHTAFKNYDAYNFVRKLYSRVLLWLLKKCATVCVGGSEMANRSLFGDHPAKTVYATINFKDFDAKRFPEPLCHSDPVLIQVAGFCDNKNQLFSVEVLRELKRYYPGARLMLVGGSKLGYMQQYREKVEETIQQYALQESVSFLPQDADIPRAMGQADYLIFPSLCEGLGIVAIEAQALGMRCFVSDSIPQEINCGGCTFLPLAEGASHWAKVIKEDFSYSGGAREQWNMEKFHTDQIMNGLKKLYDGAIE